MKQNTIARIALALFVAAIFSATAYAESDTDSDGVPDNADNCSLVPNPTQCDGDGDNYGNHCDGDFNNDLIINGLDVGPLKAGFGTADPVTDLNCDGITNGLDVGPFKAMFGTAPGPGAVADPVTYAVDIQPVLGVKCAPCHTSLGFGGHNIGTTYLDALLNSSACPGLIIAECALIRIQNGSMPPVAGCTGDPALDAGNASCLNEAEQNLIQLWLDDGAPE